MYKPVLQNSVFLKNKTIRNLMVSFELCFYLSRFVFEMVLK
jgi:hypothetical protein